MINHRQRGLLVLAMLVAAPANGQIAFESASGETSVLLREQGILSFNFAKGEFGLGAAFTIPGNQDVLFGLTGEASPKGKFLGILRGDSLTLEEGTVSGLLTVFLRERFKPAFFTDHFVAAEVSFTSAQYDLVREPGSARTPYEADFQGWGATGYYNAFMPGPFKKGMLLALSAGYGSRNNVGDFDEVEVCTMLSVEGSTDRVVQACQAAALGEFEADGAGIANGDLLIYTGLAGNRVVFGPFVRYDPLRKDEFRPGAGIYLSKDKDNLLAFIGGLTVEWAGDRPVVGLQVGIPLWGTAIGR